jgi:hypothetical protein
MANERVYLLCRFADLSGLYQSWIDKLGRPYEIIREGLTDWHVPEDAAIVISHMHYRWEEIHALRRIHEANRVPVLILADGILEYRNIFEHPELADGSVYQPIIGHKLACIGRGQARVVESWGNVGKCEVVGLPRLDSLLTASPVATNTPNEFRLLIATAKKPAFNDSQRQSVLESLRLLKERFERRPQVHGRTCIPVWRLTDGLDQELGVSVAGAERKPLHEAIRMSDAVITTPSTLYLESALLGKPTALLDFHNKPHFVPAAWMINSPRHVNAIIDELAAPPASRMLFQSTVLHDQLECTTPATPRLLTLIDRMIDAGRKSRETGRPIELPSRILDDPSQGFPVVETGFPLSELFPDNPVIGNSDLSALQLELNLAIKRLQELPDENAKLYRQLVKCRNAYSKMFRRNRSNRGRLFAAKSRLEIYRKKMGQIRERLRKNRKRKPDA